MAGQAEYAGGVELGPFSGLQDSAALGALGWIAEDYDRHGKTLPFFGFGVGFWAFTKTKQRTKPTITT
jgi:hypothetical protein